MPSMVMLISFDIGNSDRECPKSLPTFRRALKDAIDLGQLPDELTALGLVADFETRRSANPKDNQVKWLRFD